MECYKERFIKDIESGRICLSGVIISKDNDNIVLDDKTGIITVNIETNFDVGNYVRVFGICFDDFLRGEIIQELNNSNKELHRSVKELLY
ncbi:MAG: hypothetical protein V1663_04560 [archaeon]